MPVYEFINPNTNELSQHLLTVEGRDSEVFEDGVKLKRLTVPSRIFVSNNPTSPLDFTAHALRGYKEREEQGKLKKRHGSFTPEQVKRIWAQPPVKPKLQKLQNV